MSGVTWTGTRGSAASGSALSRGTPLSAPSASRIAGLLALDLEGESTGTPGGDAATGASRVPAVARHRAAGAVFAIFTLLVAAAIHAALRSGSLAAPSVVPPGRFEATAEESAMRKNPKSFAVAAAAALSVAAGAAAVPSTGDAVQWRVEDGGNGHWYAIVLESDGLAWSAANTRATAMGGHLATIHSTPEDEFVFQRANQVDAAWSGPYSLGPWLGGSQLDGSAEPAGGWTWVTGEAWDYRQPASWNSGAGLVGCGGSADNGGSGPAENSLHYIWRHRCWNDAKPTGDYFGDGRVRSFAIEWSADCNGDGVVDFGQIRAGELEDANANNVPDCCEGQLVSWGNNSVGQSTPPILRAPIASIAAGYDHSSCLLSDGTVLVWGYNAFGQRDVPANLQNVVQISAGDRFMLALQANGVVRAWGFNDYGQCNVPADLPFIVKISAGGNHSMAQLSDGTLRCWGNNTSGESTVPTDLGSVSVFEGGVYHSIAVTTSSSMW